VPLQGILRDIPKRKFSLQDIDGGKKINGRKRHIITDTLGLLLAVVVHAANVHDSKGATDVIALLKGRVERLVKIVADWGYRGELIEKTKTAFS
jgi:putative transposase